MSDKVVSLKGGEIVNERRDAFVHALAASFDLYVKTYGVEPDAVAYVLGGITQSSQTGWDVRGGSIDGSTSFLALAAASLTGEVMKRHG